VGLGCREGEGESRLERDWPKIHTVIRIPQYLPRGIQLCSADEIRGEQFEIASSAHKKNLNRQAILFFAFTRVVPSPSSQDPPLQFSPPPQ
jgi:hypothetical protein